MRLARVPPELGPQPVIFNPGIPQGAAFQSLRGLAGCALRFNQSYRYSRLSSVTRRRNHQSSGLCAVSGALPREAETIRVACSGHLTARGSSLNAKRRGEDEVRGRKGVLSFVTFDGGEGKLDRGGGPEQYGNNQTLSYAVPAPLRGSWFEDLPSSESWARLADAAVTPPRRNPIVTFFQQVRCHRGFGQDDQNIPRRRVFQVSQKEVREVGYECTLVACCSSAASAPSASAAEHCPHWRAACGLRERHRAFHP